MHDINIIIVNYKMKDHIDRCLSSLLADFTGENLNVHIVVVDNASYDGIEQLLKERYPAVQCIVQPQNYGFGKAQNIGMAAVEAKYHFILNPDTYFYPGEHTLKKLYDFMEAHPRIAIVGPKILYPDGSLQYSCYRFPTFWHPIFSRTQWGQKGMGKKMHEFLLMKDFDHNRTMPVDWIMGSAMFARGAAIKEVGVFDDRFWMYYEDSDWCRRMWEAGWAVYYMHSIKIEHVHNRDSAKIPGAFKALLKNNLARVHVVSWLKYMWKWRGNYRYYTTKR